jgi:hypothetical protein
MIGLPSLEALDSSQRVRIWLASEATDIAVTGSNQRLHGKLRRLD